MTDGHGSDDLYRTLGVPSGATDEEITRAYRRLAREHHPDANPDAPSETFAGLTDAYDVLRDPRRRRAYDDTRAARSRAARDAAGVRIPVHHATAPGVPIGRSRAAIESVEVAITLSFEQAALGFTRIVVTEIRRNKRLLECTGQSFLGAVMLAAQFGLEPGPAGLSYLIPRRNRREGTTEVQFIIGYRGYADLARRSGVVIDAQVVRQSDHFQFEYGLEPKLSHRPKMQGRGDPICAYTIGRSQGLPPVFVVLSLHDIEARRSKSAAKDDGPWKTDWEAMARKSAVRALASYLPTNPELVKAEQLDEVVRTDITTSLEDFEPPAALTENATSGAGDDGSAAEPESAPTDPVDVASSSKSPATSTADGGESGKTTDSNGPAGSDSPPSPVEVEEPDASGEVSPGSSTAKPRRRPPDPWP